MKKTLLTLIFISLSFVIYSQDPIHLGVYGAYYDIKSDNNGTIHLLWIDGGRAKYGQIVGDHVVNKITIPNILRGEVNSRKFRPRIAVKPDGTEVHFVWVSPNSTNSKRFMHSWKDSSGTWRKETIYNSNPNYVQYPAITVDSAGVVHATCIKWRYSSDNHPILYFRKAVGGSWIRQTNLAGWGAKHLWMTMFTDSTGKVHITWDRNKRVLQYRTAPSGGNLANSTTVTLPKVHGRNKQSDVYVDNLGNVHVAALSYNDPGHIVGIDYWSKPAGAAFRSPVRASASDFRVSNYLPHPVVIANSLNMVAVSWADKFGAHAKIRASLYDGTKWTQYTLDETGLFFLNTKTALAMNSTTAFLVWRSASGELSLKTFDFNVTGVISPNGGENWHLGKTHKIRWNLENATGNVDIHLYKNDVDLGKIASDLPDNGSYDWTITTLEGGTEIAEGNDYKIEVKAINGSDSDISNNNFAISIDLLVTSPKSTDRWTMGHSYDITWKSSAGASSGIKINIFKDSVSVANFIEQLTGPNNGLYGWTIPAGYEEGNYILRIKTDDNRLSDDSDLFYIENDPSATPTITVTAPSTGVIWRKGLSYDIKWTKTGTQSDNVNIKIYTDSIDPGNLVEQLTGPNSRTYNWTIPTSYSNGSYILRVETDDAAVHGDSGIFTIATNSSLPPSITVTSPTSNDRWEKGTTHNITWDREGNLSANVKINVFRNSILQGNFVEQLTGPNSGTYSWTIPNGYTSGNYVLRIKTDDNKVSDDSDIFAITGSSSSPTITVTSPTLNDDWLKGNSYNITWTKTGTQSANIKINIFRNSISQGNFVEQLTGPNSGTYSWTIPTSYLNGAYILRIKTDDNKVSGDSDQFMITASSSDPPKLTVVSPSQCSTWSKNYSYVITWLKQGTLSANVKINVFRNSISQGNFVEQLTGPNTGSYSWNIPSSYSNGNYILRIKTSDNQTHGDSQVFVINSSTISPPKIVVTSPTNCDSWKKLNTYKIAWTKVGTMSENVKINIFRNSVSSSNFVEQLTGPNSGSINWTISNTYQAGTYIIRIKTSDNSVFADSELFQIID